ncbi:hypothetical protein BJ165DRAFT_1507802 [Panaeolus papilionaceus]|nr:hypothetical protein BJ165DRAFT_1507802 [Panaeolus papilionaceus]
MSSPIVYLVTGANRGIGLAIVQALVKKPDVYVYAAARKLSPSLEEAISNNPNKASFVSFVAADEASNKAAAKVISDKFGRIDVVLHVAGIANYLGSAEETPAAELEEHFKVNVTGTLVLFQAFAPLLRKSNSPKFIPFSSGAGSLTAYIDMSAGYTVYGASKVALNYLSRKIHFENEWLTCFPLAPGVVDTDMGNFLRSRRLLIQTHRLLDSYFDPHSRQDRDSGNYPRRNGCQTGSCCRITCWHY